MTRDPLCTEMYLALQTWSTGALEHPRTRAQAAGLACSFIFLGAPDCGGVKETRAVGGLLLLWHGLAATRATPTFAMQPRVSLCPVLLRLEGFGDFS